MFSDDPRPAGVSCLTPLMLPVGKAVLEALLVEVLATIERRRQRELEMPDDRFELDLVIAQRVEFLTWVRAQPGPTIDMALYPLATPAVEEDALTPGLDLRTAHLH